MKKRVEVMEDNFGDLLVQGLKEAVAVREGRLEPARAFRSRRAGHSRAMISDGGSSTHRLRNAEKSKAPTPPK